MPDHLVTGMPYDKMSFLAGIAAGRNMRSWPTMEYGTNVFCFTLLVSESTFNRYVFTATFSGTIYWGDRTSETGSWTGRIEHTYSIEGLIQVMLVGDLTDICFSLGYFSIINDMLISIDSPLPPIPQSYPRPIQRTLQNHFFGCRNLISIPDGYFDKWFEDDLVIIDSENLFAYCEMASLPDHIFDKIKLASGVRLLDMFSHSAIAELPDDLFSSEEFRKVSNIAGMFDGCDNLYSLSNNLFANFSGATNAAALFRDCSRLSSVSSDLLSGLVGATTIEGLFSGSGLTSIPSGLFVGLNSVTSARNCFYGTKIGSIGAMALEGLNNLHDASFMFYGCLRLTSVSSSVFDNLPITNFEYCFYNDRAITSEVPELWISHPGATGTNCFTRCTNAYNYQDIPSSWGGPST